MLVRKGSPSDALASPWTPRGSPPCARKDCRGRRSGGNSDWERGRFDARLPRPPKTLSKRSLQLPSNQRLIEAVSRPPKTLVCDGPGQSLKCSIESSKTGKGNLQI